MHSIKHKASDAADSFHLWTKLPVAACLAAAGPQCGNKMVDILPQGLTIIEGRIGFIRPESFVRFHRRRGV